MPCLHLWNKFDLVFPEKNCLMKLNKGLMLKMITFFLILCLVCVEASIEYLRQFPLWMVQQICYISYNFLPQYNWNIVESGIKHHNPKPTPTFPRYGKEELPKFEIFILSLILMGFFFSLISIWNSFLYFAYRFYLVMTFADQWSFSVKLWRRNLLWTWPRHRTLFLVKFHHRLSHTRINVSLLLMNK